MFSHLKSVVEREPVEENIGEELAQTEDTINHPVRQPFCVVFFARTFNGFDSVDTRGKDLSECFRWAVHHREKYFIFPIPTEPSYNLDISQKPLVRPGFQLNATTRARFYGFRQNTQYQEPEQLMWLTSVSFAVLTGKQDKLQHGQKGCNQDYCLSSNILGFDLILIN